MVSEVVWELTVGVYLGIVTAFFPALVAFMIGLSFKYFTGLSIPALAVVVLSGTLAGISGGLMGLMSEEIVESWAGITAFLVILMACLWAHSQGDKLGGTIPRRLTIKNLKSNRLSADFVERVDSFGQIRIRPVGDVHDIEGYPPLPEDVRAKVKERSWKFPADLPIDEIEEQLEEKLVSEFEIAEAIVELDREGRASISAAPSSAGLSRRVPNGMRAVSIRTLVPTGLYRGDRVTVRLPDGDVTGEILSAQTNTTGGEPNRNISTDGGEEPEPTVETGSSTTTGGEGEITIALPFIEARRVIDTEFAPIHVQPRGKQREYEAIGILEQHGNRFRKIIVAEESDVCGKTIGELRIRDDYGVAVLSIRRGTNVTTVPKSSNDLQAGDELIVVGQRDAVNQFEGVAA